MKKLLCSTVLLTTLTMPVAAEDTRNVTTDTFVRAETDAAIKIVVDQVGVGNLSPIRAPTPIDQQDVIRMNRDTLYASAIVDLSEPATITLPDAGDRYMSMEVVNQDHYANATTVSGEHVLNQDNVGTRYAYLIFRIFVDPGNPEDVRAVNDLQDQIVIDGLKDVPLELPNWDQEQLVSARSALNEVAKLGVEDPAIQSFGMPADVDPVAHYLYAAAGWGGLPNKNAIYSIVTPEPNDGTPLSVTVHDVPVDAFWSVTVYNSQGYLEENPLGVYSFNNVTSQPNDEGSFTLNFGGCEDGRINCIPVSDGWNYIARMYEPHEEIRNGSWTFPVAAPVE